MSRRLTPASTLETLKREAKRWHRALRAHDAEARARLVRSTPDAPAKPGLRDVQHALAREYGMPGWSALKREVAALEAQRADDTREQQIIRLLVACEHGDAEGVRALLDAAPDIVNERAVIPGHTGLRTALHHAVEHADVAAILLARGADPNIRDEGDNAMALHFAAEREDLSVIRMLIEHGADPIGTGDDHELDVIGWATCFGSGRRDVVEYLLAHGARYNIFSAVALGEADVIRSLVSATPADLDRPMDHTNLRRRPLHLAVVKRQPRSVAALLAAGANAEALDAAGLTPLDQAALNGETGLVQQLVDHGVQVTLPAAIALEQMHDVERLLARDPQALKPGGRWATLIIRASERGSSTVIEALIRAGADVNVRDDAATSVDGVANYTALHAAAFHGNAGAVKVLLAHGANPNVRDDRYCGPPAGWAAYAGHTAVRDLILDTARIDLFQAIDFGRVERIPARVSQSPWLLDDRTFGDIASCGADHDAPEPWHTPLVWAVLRNRVDAARVLLEEGAAPRLSPDGRTLLDLARDAGHEPIVDLLIRHSRPDATHEGRVRWFLKNACPDHNIRGLTDHAVARNTAARLLQRHPEIAHDSFVTSVVCGDVVAVEHALAERPALAREPAGPKGWTPLLYLCFTRLPSVAATSDNALAIARLLLDHGADPNAFFMAGDSRYTPLVGAIGEGEEDRPAHPRRDALVRLLLEHDAEPYDIQVLYNVHFHGRVLWFLERIHEHSLRRGRHNDWQDPEWRMLDMGGYGTGARYLLEIAVLHNDAALAEWLLAHGANPDSPPPTDPRWPKLSMYEAALREGHTELADLLVRHGARPSPVEITAEEDFIAACVRFDRDRVQTLAAVHPEVLRSARAILAAAGKDRADAVAFLLDLGVPIEIENEHRQRALHVAAWNDAVQVAQVLIDRGAEIDPRETEFGNTPLDCAVYYQHARMIELLCRHSRDVWNLTFVGAVERIRDVLHEQPDLARLNADGWTPLMWLPDDETAAVAIIEQFLAHGADPRVRERNGYTAADHAERRGLLRAAALLRAHEQPDGRVARP